MIRRGARRSRLRHDEGLLLKIDFVRPCEGCRVLIGLRVVNECFLSPRLINRKCLKYQEGEWMEDLLYLEDTEGNLLENGQIVDDEITAHWK